MSECRPTDCVQSRGVKLNNTVGGRWERCRGGQCVASCRFGQIVHACVQVHAIERRGGQCGAEARSDCESLPVARYSRTWRRRRRLSSTASCAVPSAGGHADSSALPTSPLRPTTRAEQCQLGRARCPSSPREERTSLIG